MDDLIRQLEELTERAINELSEMEYEELEGFVSERETIIDHIVTFSKGHALTEQQEQRVFNILQQDGLVMSSMQVLRDEARDWLHQRNMAKVQRSSYETQYAPDSVIMDKKK